MERKEATEMQYMLQPCGMASGKLFSLAKRLGLIGGLAPQLKKKIKINPFEALLIWLQFI